MAFIDQRLPQEIELGAVRREVESIETVETDGGFEDNNARWSRAKFEYDVGFPADTFDSATRLAVKALYKVCRGRLHAFRFRDFDPVNSVLTAEPIGTGNGTATQFQIKKSWTVAGNTVERVITRPVNSVEEPMTVTKNGVVQTSGFTINLATGIVTFTVPPAAGHVIAVSGVFDVPVKFVTALETTALTGWLEHVEGLSLIEVFE